MALRSRDTGPSGASRMRQPIVRTRKLVQNGTITRRQQQPSPLRVHACTASQYANGHPITRQMKVPGCGSTACSERLEERRDNASPYLRTTACRWRSWPKKGLYPKRVVPR